MVATLDIKGLDEAIGAVDQVGGRDRRRILAAGDRGAAQVARKAARRTAAFQDRSGQLRRSINVRSRRLRVRLAAESPHAHLVELGHGGPRPAGPHPFMVPAVVMTRTEQLQAAGRAVFRALQRLAARRGRHG